MADDFLKGSLQGLTDLLSKRNRPPVAPPQPPTPEELVAQKLRDLAQPATPPPKVYYADVPSKDVLRKARSGATEPDKFVARYGFERLNPDQGSAGYVPTPRERKPYKEPYVSGESNVIAPPPGVDLKPSDEAEIKAMHNKMFGDNPDLAGFTGTYEKDLQTLRDNPTPEVIAFFKELHGISDAQETDQPTPNRYGSAR